MAFAGNALAQTSSDNVMPVPSPAAYAPSMFGIIIKLIFSMILIVGLIYLSSYFLKKMNSRSAGTGSVSDIIKVLGRSYIAPKQCLYVVKIGDRYSVLGATESNINFISELSKEEADKYEKVGVKSGENAGFAKFSDIFKGKLHP
jgi:flagellar biosynthetic protein FliO